MVNLNDLAQTGDWTKEKHVPVIDYVGDWSDLKKNNPIKVKITIGKEIPHPNTAEHHIAWVNVYFLPDKEKLLQHVGKFDFNSHGASSTKIFTNPDITFSFKTEKEGTLIVFSFCNIHGLWKNESDFLYEEP